MSLDDVARHFLQFCRISRERQNTGNSPHSSGFIRRYGKTDRGLHVQRHDSRRNCRFHRYFDGIRGKIELCEAVEQRKSPAGFFRVSNPELTAYDVLAYERCCPSLDLAATIFAELGESVDASRLSRLAEQGAKAAVLQRVGWLLDRTGWREKTEGLHEALRARRQAWRAMDSRLPKAGEKSDRWKVVENADVQPDVGS